jgi:hypothetical protein
MGYAFRGITEQKATGLGAVAGGLSESFVWANIGGDSNWRVRGDHLNCARHFRLDIGCVVCSPALSICLSGWMLLLLFLLLAVLVLASPQLLIRILGAIVILIRLVCSPFREERENWGPWRSNALPAKSRFCAALGMTKEESE